MKIHREELSSMIKSEVDKQEKKIQLENRVKELEGQLSLLNEDFTNPASQGQRPAAEKSESIFDAKPGETVVFNFQDVTLKLQRQLDDLFKVTDAAESKKLKEGDYIKIQGNDTLQNGKKFKFVILREALKYESNPLVSWRVIKNR